MVCFVLTLYSDKVFSDTLQTIIIMSIAMIQNTFPTTRLRRLRRTPAIRSLIKETQLDISKLIQPLFIRHGQGIKQAIAAMPGQYQFSIDQLSFEVQALNMLGINSVLLFGIPEYKDEVGSSAYQADGIIQKAITTIKKNHPEMLIITDVCCCEYTEHGHCGYIKKPYPTENVDVDNDASLALLAKQAVSYAQAGADIIAPSANMDGMVYAIRQALDEASFTHLPILSYSVKYASAMYGPFRQAAEGAPKFGDRRSYQMDYANSHEAIRECQQDIAEGADMLMVKPAHTYLDIIHKVKQQFPELPLSAYHTSGEYSMLKAAAANGWVDEAKAVLEILTAIRRAGADFIITYYAKDVASWLKS